MPWYAIKTPKDFQAEKQLAPHVDSVFFPKETVRRPDGHTRVRALIPHVLFVHTSAENITGLEARSRSIDDPLVAFRVYRDALGEHIQPIDEREIALLRLLTAPDDTRCEVFHKADFTPGQSVTVTAGPFAGYTGTIQRVRKNRHVAVRIQGICTILLPFIHPSLLSPNP